MKILVNFFALLLVLSVPRCQDAEVNSEIEKQLAQNESLLGLSYPKSVKRFYLEKGYKSVWMQSPLKPSQTWSSMLLLDCTQQFGLSYSDYHPDELSYPKLHRLLDDPRKTTAREKARFEIVLTDAILTFINDLHFGKANPFFSRSLIDKGNLEGFNAETVLANAIGSEDFMAALLDVQPKSKAYVQLQQYMTSIRGQYIDGNYEVPETEARKVAVNLERLKWNDVVAETYIQVNIPAYTLVFNLPDTAYEFKIAVGRPLNATPRLSSAISYISTAPDWTLPKAMLVREVLPKALAEINFLEDHHYTVYDLKGNRVDATVEILKKMMQNPGSFIVRQSSGCELSLGTLVFHFPNPTGIYLYDGQGQPFFNTEQRALTNGCISIQDPLKLASLMLAHDGEKEKFAQLFEAASRYQVRNFVLKHPIPLSIVYQTCTIKDGQLVSYPDCYRQDEALLQLLYGSDTVLANRN